MANTTTGPGGIRTAPGFPLLRPAATGFARASGRGRIRWPISLLGAGVVALLTGCAPDEAKSEAARNEPVPLTAPPPSPPSPPASPRPRGLSGTERLQFVTHLQQGLELARRFDAERALVEFDRCLALDPGHLEARFQRGRMLLLRGAVDEALALLEELAALEPAWLPARQILNAFHNASDGHGDASRRAASAASVRRACGRLGEFDLQVARWLTEGSGPSPCANLARRRIPSGRPPPDPFAELAYSYSRRFDMGGPPRSWEEDHDRNAQVERYFRGVVDRFPGLAALCVEHAMWLLKSQVRFSLTERPDLPPLSSSIVLDVALQYTERALDTCVPGTPLAHYSLLAHGHVARDMGDFEQAVRDYELVLAQPGLLPRLAFEAHFNLAVVYFRTGKPEQAREHLVACAKVRNGPMVAWLRKLCGETLALREEEVTDEHRRTLKFVDRAAELGIAKYDGAGPSGWSDVDLDGDLDLFVAGCDTYSALYRNDDGRFTDVSRAAGLENIASGFSATFADYDNDGDDDLYVGRNGWSGPASNSLYQNQGDGKFVDVTAAAGLEVPGSTFVHGWLDYDRDGNLDLFLANGITGDGSTNALYRNEGDGTFTDVTAAAGLAEEVGTQTIGFAIGDFDRDCWPDIFVNSWSTRNRLYHNRKDGTFEEVAEAAGIDGRAHPKWGYVAFMADFDNDTWPDVLLTKIAKFGMFVEGQLAGYVPNRGVTDYATKFYRNRGDGTFEDRSEAAGLLYAHGTMGANIGDLNNDGYLDFYLGTGDPMLARLEPNALYVNTGHGSFVELTRFTGTGHVGKGHGITFADYDFDGDLDVYSPQGGFVHGDLWPNAFFVNERGSANHWLAVQLVGTKSNRMGVGAQLTLRAGDLVLYREMTAGGAFGSSNGPFVHFGLGNRATIDRLEIVWPSGTRAAYTDLAGDRYLRLTEGTAAAVPLFAATADPRSGTTDEPPRDREAKSESGETPH